MGPLLGSMEASYTSADDAAAEIAEALHGNASITVRTDQRGTSGVVEAKLGDEEEAVKLHTRDGSRKLVYPGEITEITAIEPFSVGDRVVWEEDGRRGTIVSITERGGENDDRAKVQSGSGGGMSVPVSELVQTGEAAVECAGDDCRRPAVKEVSGCERGELEYTLRVCRSCEQKVNSVLDEAESEEEN